MDKPRTAASQIDELCAIKVMGWVKVVNTWCKRWSEATQQREEVWHTLFRPTEDTEAMILVWLKCLEEARLQNYKVSMSVDDEGLITIIGDHPLNQRLQIIEKKLPIAVCRFALRLVGQEIPWPFDIDAGTYKTDLPE